VKKYLLLILVVGLFFSCSDESSSIKGVSLQTVTGGTVSSLDYNDYNLSIVKSPAPGGVSLYFITERGGTNQMYTSDLQAGSLWSDPVEFVSSGFWNTNITSFAVLPVRNGVTNIIFYKKVSDGPTQVFVSPFGSIITCFDTNSSPIPIECITILGVLPGGAKYQTIQIGANNVGLVTEKNGFINVYEYATNSIIAPLGDLIAVNQYTGFPHNGTVTSGGGSFVPGAVIGMSGSDGFLYSRSGVNGQDIFMTDFTWCNKNISRLNGKADDTSPHFNTMNNKVYFSSTSYSANGKFNLYVWDFYSIGVVDAFPLDLVRPILYIDSSFPSNRADVTFSSPPSIYGRAEDFESGVFKVFILWNDSSTGLPVAEILLGTNSVWSNNLYPVGMDDRDAYVYAVDKAGNYSATNVYTNIYHC